MVSKLRIIWKRTRTLARHGARSATSAVAIIAQSPHFVVRTLVAADAAEFGQQLLDRVEYHYNHAYTVLFPSLCYRYYPVKSRQPTIWSNDRTFRHCS